MSTHVDEPRRRGGAIWLLLPIVILVALSEHLAFNRLFVVDELQNVFTARLLATGQAANYMSSANLLILGPMTWLAGAFDRSAPMLRAERFLFFPLFWLNLCLIVRCAGFRLRSKAGAIALLLVATLAPFWHYGFEIRHETPLLTAVLLAWLAARPMHSETRRPFVVGLLAVVGQFVAFKAFVYFVPIALFTVVASWWFDRRPLPRVLGLVAGGALTGFIACRAAHYVAGTWTFFSADTKGLGFAIANQVHRMNPWPTLKLFAMECPLVLLGIICAAVFTIRGWNWSTLVARESTAPEAAFCLSGIVALLANPTPFPYNLVIPTAQASVLLLRLRPDRKWYPALAWLAVLHGALWMIFTSRHYTMTNARQTEVMTLAEQMTDPVRHRVFDGAGLVPTRLPPNRFWLLTFITLPSYHRGELPSIRSELAKGETPVVIPNYRIRSLPGDDRAYIGEHYLPLAGDFYVAGGRIAQPGKWECVVPGRYYLSSEAMIDGVAHRSGPLELGRGMHEVRPASSAALWIVWLGPSLNAPPAIGPGSAERIVLTFS